MTDDDEHYMQPAPPRGAIPIGPSQGRPYGVVAEGPTPPPPAPSRTKRAQETRRKEPDTYADVGMDQPQYNDPPQQDRHSVGEHPFDAALAELYRQWTQVRDAIDLLEKLKGQTP